MYSLNQKTNFYITQINNTSKSAFYELYDSFSKDEKYRHNFCNTRLTQWCAFNIITGYLKLSQHAITEKKFLEDNTKYMELLLAIKNDPESGFDKYYLQKEKSMIENRANENSILYSINCLNEVLKSDFYSTLFGITRAEKELLTAKHKVGFEYLDKHITDKKIKTAMRIAEVGLQIQSQTAQENTK